MSDFTPSEKVIVAVLGDGQQHSVKEMLEVLDTSPGMLTKTVCLLRAKLKQKGRTIVTHFTNDPVTMRARVVSYQLVERINTE